MKRHQSAGPWSLFLGWLDSPTVSPAERVHLRVLQGVQIVIGLLFVLSEIRGASSGIDRFSNVLVAVAAAISFWWLRKGRFRPSVLLLLSAFTLGMSLALVGTGLHAQGSAIKYAVLPQILAGLLLGALALWVVSAILGVAIVGAATTDLASAGVRLEEATASAWIPALQALLFVVLIALVVDRVGAVLRRSFGLALQREEQLATAKNHLEERKLEVEELFLRLENSYEETLRSLSAALDLRDRETQGHAARVVGYSTLLGTALGLDEKSLRELRWGALLHDVGKIAVPDRILNKRGPLTPDEWEVVRRHPDQGFRMLRHVSFLGPSLDVVLHHHERWDGKGYPRGLAETAIPEMARIFSVVDTYDAMTSERSYSAARPVEEVRNELRQVVAKQLDPEIVASFLAIDREHLETVRRMAIPSVLSDRDESSAASV